MDMEKKMDVLKRMLRDSTLTLKAKGVLTYLIKEELETVSLYDKVFSSCADGRGTVRSAIIELVNKGYITRVRERGPDGKLKGITHKLTESTTER